MPNRILKETIKQSQTIAKLKWFEEVCFYHLLVTVDDFGRYYRDPLLLKNELFPRRDDLTAKAIDDAFEVLERSSLIECYWVGDERYLQVCTWKKHQQTRAKTSKFPAKESDVGSSDTACEHMISNDIRCKQTQSDDNNGNQTISDDNGCGQMFPYSYSYSDSVNARARDPDRPFVSDEEAKATQMEVNAVLDKAEETGLLDRRKLGKRAFDKKAKIFTDELYPKYGKDRLIEAMEQAFRTDHPYMDHLQMILEGKATGQKESEEKSYADEWWEKADKEMLF